MGAQGGSLAFGLAGAALGFVTFGAGFAVSAGFLGGVLLYSATLGNKQGSKPQALSGLINFTTNAEGAPIPVIFGRQLTSGYQMYYNDFQSQSRSVGGGSGGLAGGAKGGAVTYTVDIAILLCFGTISKVNDILINKDSIWGSGPLSYSDGDPTTISTSKGNFKFYWGIDDQPYSSYFQAINTADFPTATNPPRFNWYSYYITDNFDLGSNPSYPQVLFDLTRYPDTSLAVDPNIGDDANPACVAWEIITNPIWGCSIPEGYLDAEAFKIVGEQLKDEGLGISFTLDSNKTATSVLQDIMSWTNMFFFINTSGELSVSLLRENTEITSDNYIVIDDKHLLPGSLEVSSSSVSSLINQVKAQWTNKDKNFIAQTVVVNNPASQQSYGLRFQNVNLSGLTSAENANKQANRLLIGRSLPLRQAQFECNKYTTRPWVGRYILLCPGSWNSSDYMLMFITQVEETEIGSGTVKVTAVEDRLSFMASVAYGPASEVVASQSRAVDCCDQYRLYELPVGINTDDYQVIAVAGQKPNRSATGFTLWAKQSTSANLRKVTQKFQYVPAGTLVTALDSELSLVQLDLATVDIHLDGYNDTLVETVTDSEYVADTQLMLVGEELISVKSVTSLGSNNYRLTGLRRVVKGSTGDAHAIGDQIYFIRSLLQPANFITSTEIEPGSEWTYMITPFNNVSEVGISDCSTKTFTFSG